MQKQNIYTPLQLWEHIHCRHCPFYKTDKCKPQYDTPINLRCILAHIAENLELIRKILDQRTRHLSW